MKLWIRSDLHFRSGGVPSSFHFSPAHDVQILAGDIMPVPGYVIDGIDRLATAPIVYVAGNHEFYGACIDDEIADARRASQRAEHVRFLENAMTVIAGVRFLGATLWTDYALDPVFDVEMSMQAARQSIRDHDAITTRPATPGRPSIRFTPQDALALHRESRAWLKHAFSTPFDGPTVVVTHHAPSPLSIHDRYEGDIVNAAFASDLTADIERWQPALWIHGHVHNRFDYRIGKTRVICNPAGYAHEDTSFDPELVIDL